MNAAPPPQPPPHQTYKAKLLEPRGVLLVATKAVQQAKPRTAQMQKEPINPHPHRPKPPQVHRPSPVEQRIKAPNHNDRTLLRADKTIRTAIRALVGRINKRESNRAPGRWSTPTTTFRDQPCPRTRRRLSGKPANLLLHHPRHRTSMVIDHKDNLEGRGRPATIRPMLAPSDLPP